MTTDRTEPDQVLITSGCARGRDPADQREAMSTEFPLKSL
ncbi:hypothetical protein B0I32_102259 [Nonomuraea fuscirosea]|uniref:Uncharacterized protein n=1 Tax=Nonomuraea fuscirosea TaxID=1291556 RepID=A0A2T0N8T4_9ACTN|nr:hypothetical protein B0I32_102259 [Nonomuraea fuscirosea]